MAHGFTAEEEQTHSQIAAALQRKLGDKYTMHIGNNCIGGWVAYAPTQATRKRIVRDVTEVLIVEGFSVVRTQETQTSRCPYTFIEVNGVAISVGAARRGGLGAFPSKLKEMNDAITETVAFIAKKNHDEQMKSSIRAKLNADEIAFLKL